MIYSFYHYKSQISLCRAKTLFNYAKPFLLPFLLLNTEATRVIKSVVPCGVEYTFQETTSRYHLSIVIRPR